MHKVKGRNKRGEGGSHDDYEKEDFSVRRNPKIYYNFHNNKVMVTNMEKRLSMNATELNVSMPKVDLFYELFREEQIEDRLETYILVELFQLLDNLLFE